MKETSKPVTSDVSVVPTKLSVRLMEIVSAVPACERVLDIGSDHGHVPSWLLENHIAKRAVATDIHADPAETTRRYLRRQGVMQYADVYHTDGLHKITVLKGDVVIISGLGGLEMIRVMSEALTDHQGSFPDGTRFVLQPQRSLEELRTFLTEEGFAITNERLSLDRDKFYIIISAEWTGKKSEPLSLTEKILGPVLIVSQPENFTKYLHHQKNVLKKHARARPELTDILITIDEMLSGEITP
jgi:tRNA (adenine22-N1)-methyltransferase